jgi:hypothetical protein
MIRAALLAVCIALAGCSHHSPPAPSDSPQTPTPAPQRRTPVNACAIPPHQTITADVQSFRVAGKNEAAGAAVAAVVAAE